MTLTTGNIAGLNSTAHTIRDRAFGHAVELVCRECGATQPLGPNGPPANSTYEDNAIGKNASITEVQTCWMGFIRNNVSGNVNYQNNVTADDDGNEVVTNTVARNLNCSGNSPAPQFGDSGGIPNTVSGHANGQCAGPLSGGG